MPQKRQGSVQSFLDAIASPLVDTASLLCYLWLLPLLPRLYETGSSANALIVLGAYTMMCLGVLLGRSLEEPEIKAGLSGKAQAFTAWVAWPFAIFVLLVLIEVTGGIGAEAGAPSLFDRISESGPWPMMLASLLILAIAVAFPLSITLPARRIIGRGGLHHTALKLLSVALVNAMVLVTMAFWEWYFATAQPVQLSLGARIFVMLAAFPLLLMFYAPPRLALLSLDRNGWGALSYTALLAIAAWNFPL